MEPKKGYWIALPGAATGQVRGRFLHDYTTHFSRQGWFLIGGVNGSVDFIDPNDNPNGSVLSPAFGWDPVGQTYIPSTALNEK
jgi:hypothetical protein